MLAFSFFFFSVSFALQVLDSHVHAWMDHSKIDYTYPKGQITDYDWNFADYQRASRASQLPPSEFIFMSLRGVPKHQYILQVSFTFLSFFVFIFNRSFSQSSHMKLLLNKQKENHQNLLDSFQMLIQLMEKFH